MILREFELASSALDELLQFVAPGDLVVIHAGHVVLFWDEALQKAVASLPGEVTMSAPLREAFGSASEFTRATWAFGAALHRGAVHRGASVEHVILVNDWQFMPAGAERQAARMQFYQRHAQKDPGLGAPSDWTLVAQPAGHASIRLSPFVSEKSLRNAYSRRGRRVRSRACEVFAPSTLPPRPEPGCAEEVVELLRILAERRCVCFINLYPLPCRPHVLAGTEEFSASESSMIHTVLNVGIRMHGRALGSAMTVTVHSANDSLSASAGL